MGPKEDLLMEGMRHGFEGMCIIRDSPISMQVCCFSIYIHVYYYFISHYSQQCRYTQYTLFLCFHMEAKLEEDNYRSNQQNIQKNNRSDASGSDTDNSSNKE